MKHKVAELEGALLDAAVAKAEGITGLEERRGRMCHVKEWDPEGRRWDDDMRAWKLWEDYAPSQEWRQGGPIIERELISTWRCDSNSPDWCDEWFAAIGAIHGWDDGSVISAHRQWRGQTRLIAAMRAYVASKFGDEVELP